VVFAACCAAWAAATRTADRPDRHESASGFRIHLNHAETGDLTLLPGLSPKTAQAVQEYRRSVGGFASVDQLVEVPRIGPLTAAKLAPYVTLEP